jgi:hypothetical protein
MTPFNSDLNVFLLRFKEAGKKFSVTYKTELKQFLLKYTSDTQYGTIEGGNTSSLWFDSEGKLLKL